jgi:dihydroneopterin aldolase/D-erythro-7,8-dihydroneopterin triphosphate epimerase
VPIADFGLKNGRVKMDKIYIRELVLGCIIGCFPEEREAKQDITINLCLETDLRKAGNSDDLNDTVDYKAIKQSIIKMVEASEYALIESIAERTAEICLADKKVQRVTVTIDKLGCLRFAKSAAVEITREQA